MWVATCTNKDPPVLSQILCTNVWSPRVWDMLPSLLFILPPTHAVDIFHVEKARLGEGQPSWWAARAAYSITQWAEAASNKAAASPDEVAPFGKARLGTSAPAPSLSRSTQPGYQCRRRAKPTPIGRAGRAAG